MQCAEAGTCNERWRCDVRGGSADAGEGVGGRQADGGVCVSVRVRRPRHDNELGESVRERGGNEGNRRDAVRYDVMRRDAMRCEGGGGVMRDGVAADVLAC